MTSAKNFNHYHYQDFYRNRKFLIRVVHLWNWIVLLRNWHLRSRVNRLLNRKKEKKVLDLGSGDGQYLFYIARNFPQHHVSACDRAHENVVFTNSYLGKQVCDHLDIEKEALPGNQDVVLLIAVLQYVKDPIKVLTKISKALNAEGKALLYVPINGREVIPFYNSVRDRYEHYEITQERKRVYTEDLLKSQLKQAGLKISHKEYCVGTFGILSNELYNLFLLVFAWSNNLVFQILIIYLLLQPLIPILILLNFIDRLLPKKDGNGLLLEVEKE